MPPAPPTLVLASGSPRRRRFLEELALTFVVDAADVDESVRPDEAPPAYVERLARQKASTVAARRAGAVVIAADTTVVLENDILGKPSSDEDARRMLGRLSGRGHTVMTAVAVNGRALRSTVVHTKVVF